MGLYVHHMYTPMATGHTAQLQCHVDVMYTLYTYKESSLEQLNMLEVENRAPHPPTYMYTYGLECTFFSQTF